MNLDTYTIILHKFDDLDCFYNDMETEGGNLYIPNRLVTVSKRKPTSRVTYYNLTSEEAQQVSLDPRVESVELYISDLYPELYTVYERTSGQDISHTNWGLSIHKDTKFLSIDLPYTGKNVDVVILDDDAWQPDHPEFADSNGNSRVIAYDWYQHAEEVGDTANIGNTFTYNHDTNNGFHNIHVAGTVAGKTQGWAKDANIYFLGLAFSGNSSLYNVSTNIAFDYIRAFHRNKPINPVTGRKNPTIVNNSWGFTGRFNPYGSLIDPIDVISMTYKGQPALPAIPRVDFYEGFYGLYSSNAQIVPWPSDTVLPVSQTVKFITTGATTGTSEVLPYTPISSTDPASDDFTSQQSALITIPFTINYLGTNYTDININTRSFITFGNTYINGEGNLTSPALPKLLVASNTTASTSDIYDNRDVIGSSDAFWVKESGTAPNRTFTVMYRGFKDFLSRNAYVFLGSTGLHELTWQVVFYENELNRIDLTIERNRMNIPTGGYTIEEIQSYGCNGRTYSLNVAAVDADVIDAINDGIIMTSSAGNSSMAQFAPGHINYDNSLSGSVVTVFYNRLSTPSSAGAGQDNRMIVVGALNNLFLAGQNGIENKASYSNFGSGIDCWAAGSWIQSTWPNAGPTSLTGYGSPITGSDGFKYMKISGTSMASPQVTGLLACMLEKYPDMNQKQARQLLNTFSIHNEVYSLPLETWNYEVGLEDMSSKMILFKDIRANNKPSFPKIHKGRPALGVSYPRRQIRIRKIV